MYLYFAYGSVLSRRHVGEWAGEHGVDARLFARGAPAVLRGYKLAFDVDSRYWGGKVADLIEEKDGVVHGVLFEVPPMAKDAVLRKEGVATGLFQEIAVTVEAEGKQLAAKAFQARPEKRTEEGPASGRYVGFLVEGARERGLPEEWIALLERHAQGAAPSQPAPGRAPLTRL
jgi:gamma-glutamylcyclotransferase